MNGRDRLPRERMRPSRMCRSSSRVITFRARGALLPVFAMTCANWQAVERRRTLCQVFDHCPLSGRPTAARLAAFILPSFGRSASPTLPCRHCHDALRTFAIYGHASHSRFRSDDLGTNKLSTGDLAVEECSFDTRDAGAFSADATPFELSFNWLAGCCGLMGNNALDHPRSRSSDAETALR
jgi:hypothetical protein